ncbi:OmpA family protein [Leeuwenhoekiella blandensis]|uniref:OmpA family protein n=1 Tax=Leeuwenhoekiella blandensis (strain CECT 7118 / CCUG 51940 / KCTC 22103 / MED217) TaxID=398720 RepID=A3XR15_LEEBM|nr:OmpA family protein [Leeuwenhoekiella blandensis]EAQ48012.1 OmpA family protein [Leeuwenhoekiella blandensis MED217]
MRIKIHHLFIALFLSVLTSGFGQERKVAKGNKQFNQYAFVDSQKIYLRVAEEGYESADLFAKLGDSFYYNADYSEAVNWYSKLIEKYQSEVTPNQYFRYAQALRAEQEYDKSEEMIARYQELSDGSEDLYAEQSISEIKEGSASYEIEKLKANAAKYSDFAPAFYGEQLLFSSTRDTGVFTRRVHKWNNQPFLDLYVGDIDDQNQVNTVSKLGGSVNTEFHESTAVLSPDGNALYFTRNNFTKDQYRADSNKTNRLKLYKAAKTAEGLGAIEELPFNDNSFSTAHPAITPDGKTLYFASDRPGSLGESDLWKVAINEDGSFGTVENLGDKINTPGRETFPFISKDGKLYFSTDGRAGLGGLDVYVYDFESETLENVGAPVNSTKDDFTFIINSDTGKGFFASNRANDPLDDDIYSFIKAACESTLIVKVVDKETKEPLNGALVGIRNLDNDLIASGSAEAPEATYTFQDPECGEEYFARAEMEGYMTDEKLVEIPSESSEVTVILELEPAVTAIPPSFDLGKLINPIYFDFDKSNIRPDAAVELAKIIEILKEYPELHIDVRSHTDSRGNDAYNLALSERRNQSTIDYIVEEGGIARERLSGRGYGETQLLNECSNGVDCTKEQHQLNRRSEFIVQDY